jgi:NADH dehydrogenase (ubiquinone) 1 alpha subcomplex subunit 9
MSKSLTLFRIVSKQRNFGSLLITQKRYFQEAHSFIGNENPHTNYNTVAAVFGATGFIGKYVVEELSNQGYQVIVPWKSKELAIRDHRVLGDVGQIAPMRFTLSNTDTIKDICKRSNIVINCAGTDFDKYGNTKGIANVYFAEILAKACNEAGVERFVHVSDLGATRNGSMDSVYLRTKGEGEYRVRLYYPGATIIRPAPIFGFEDRLLNFMAKCLRVLPGVPLINRGAATIQPVYVSKKKCDL